MSLINIVCVLLRLYLARRKKPYEKSHPCYRHPGLFHIQMLKALMEQPAYTNPSVKDRNKAESVRNS